MWNRRTLLSVDALSRQDIELILDCAKNMEQSRPKICEGYVLANVFFEPSTRTEKSFEAAMYRLGGDVITLKEAGSSREKGESKGDTLRTLEQYSDIMAVRDPEAKSLQQYGISIPLINAGDGANEHPTQALLDLFTIRAHVGRLDNLDIVFAGDLRFGRTVHSLIKALRKFPGNEFHGIAPEALSMPDELRGSDYTESSFEELASLRPDIIYATRIQKERMVAWGGHETFSYEINNALLKTLPGHTKIMHPLPRVKELNPEVDKDPRVIPFLQVKGGLFVRMALLALMLGKVHTA